MPIVVGRHCTILSDNPFLTSFMPDEQVVIGNFSGLAQGVKIFSGVDHYRNNVAGYPLKILYFHKPHEMKKDVYTKGPTIIGSDVLVMYNAMVLSGVKIGDGAFVGAGAVVTKDVPPYAIVAGNPARIIKYRFSEEQIKALLEIRWWDWSDQQIYEFEEYFYAGVDTFIARAFAKMKKEGRMKG